MRELTPRQIAINLGKMTYNTGKPCKNGHTTDRYTSRGMCIGCLRDQSDKILAIRRDMTAQLVEGAMPCAALAKREYHPLIQDFTYILRYASQSTIDEVRAYITMTKGNIK